MMRFVTYSVWLGRILYEKRQAPDNMWVGARLENWPANSIGGASGAHAGIV
jgi:hypothetical protein